MKLSKEQIIEKYFKPASLFGHRYLKPEYGWGWRVNRDGDLQEVECHGGDVTWGQSTWKSFNMWLEDEREREKELKKLNDVSKMDW